jgi:hypothetical protein
MLAFAKWTLCLKCSRRFAFVLEQLPSHASAWQEENTRVEIVLIALADKCACSQWQNMFLAKFWQTLVTRAIET